MQNKGFNPRTYIRYDSILLTFAYMVTSFNPRTYIRYDFTVKSYSLADNVSIHVPI